MVYYCGMDKELPPGIQYGPVIRDVFIVECNTAGYGAAVVNGVEHRVFPGCCYFLMPGDTVIHKADNVNPRQGYWCAIDGMQINGVLNRAGITSENPFAPSGVFDEICDILKEIYRSFGEKDPGADFRRTACVYKILGALSRDVAYADSDARIQRAIGFMETSYPFNVSVEAIADAAGFERSYFSTLFKAKTGISPHAYLTSLRIRKAISLMSESELSNPEIAEAVGLDPQNFSRIFKRVVGSSPLAYKHSLAKKTSK